MARATLSVPDISCEHCERTITEALTPLEGVSTVKVDIPGKLVNVEYDDQKIGVDRFKSVLQEEDYPVESAS